MTAKRRSKTSGQPLEFFLYSLGLATRFAVAFPICLWLYTFFDTLHWCFGDGSSRDFTTDVLGCPFVAMFWTTGSLLDFDRDDSWAARPHYLSVALITLVVAVAWGVICRQRCGPAKALD
jgi:hypothetical protein